MTFRIIQHSTTCDASDVMDNFYHIAQGSVTPNVRPDLDPTDSTYDLGSSSYKWDNLYVSSIGNATIDSNGTTWELITKTSPNSATSRIEFTGIDSGEDEKDVFMNYFIITGTSTAQTVEMYFNGNSGGGFLVQYMQVDDTTMVRTQGAFLFTNTAPTTTALYSNGIARIMMNEGYDKIMHNQCVAGAGENRAQRVYVGSGTYRLTREDTITSIQIVSSSNMQPGSYISLWRRGI